MTAIENVMEGLVTARKINKREAEDIALSMLKKVGMDNWKNHYPIQLSGGQQQRVAIARAVLSNPKIILADEPTGNLDSKNGQEVMNLLSELHNEGTTIIMVTHSHHDASYADRIISLYDGEIVNQVEL